MAGVIIQLALEYCYGVIWDVISMLYCSSGCDIPEVPSAISHLKGY